MAPRRITEPTVVVDDARTEPDAPACPVDVERWRRLAVDALRSEGATGELTLTFIDRTEMAELNEQHMGTLGPTDVLSFPLDDDDDDDDDDEDDDDDDQVGRPPRLLGDIVIAPAVAGEQFADHAGTYDDELALLVVHGVLHILGHDHAEPDERLLMRGRERALLMAHHWRGPAPAAFRHDHDAADDAGHGADHSDASFAD